MVHVAQFSQELTCVDEASQQLVAMATSLRDRKTIISD